MSKDRPMATELNTQNNAGNQLKQNSILNEREQIPATPFWIVKSTINNEEQWFIVFGEYRVSEIHQSKQSAMDELNVKWWNIVMHMTAVIVEKVMQETFKPIPKENSQQKNLGL